MSDGYISFDQGITGIIWYNLKLKMKSMWELEELILYNRTKNQENYRIGKREKELTGVQNLHITNGIRSAA